MQQQVLDKDPEFGIGIQRAKFSKLVIIPSEGKCLVVLGRRFFYFENDCDMIISSDSDLIS